ncbi:MAG: 4Fe-4S binding protein [Candidatus Cloacimonas sp.]
MLVSDNKNKEVLMIRNIIEIDLDKCNGCGLCIPDCPEGALQIIDGKARLVSDLFCDGLGACIGTCPEGAIYVIEREAEPYNEEIVMENIIKAGPNTIKAHLEHLLSHNEMGYYQIAIDVLKKKGLPIPEVEVKEDCSGCGCIGTEERELQQDSAQTSAGSVNLKSELRHWPIQLHLINPMASYFENADILIAADCTPYSFANFHSRFMKDKVVMTLCPKLDHSMEKYLEKLTTIFKTHNVKSVTVVKMQVPCCTGALLLVERAIRDSGKNILLKEYTISMNGEII